MNKECIYTRDEYVLVEVLDSILEGLIFVKFPSEVKLRLDALQDCVTDVLNECEGVYYE